MTTKTNTVDIHRIFFHTDLTYYDHMPGVEKRKQNIKNPSSQISFSDNILALH